ncbi:MAG: response regulator [Deltaproteobacteria bacterium]|nr:response regulator [Deltaproteobacteria bacterium]
MKQKTILVIEDNEMNMKLMRAVLQIGNYRMLEATDAEAGLRLMKEDRPDLIFMDIQLPSMNGLAATRIIKADPGLKDIPVFAVSGFAMESDKAKAQDMGFAGYIVKPISVKALLEMLARHFSAEQTGDEPAA